MELSSWVQGGILLAVAAVVTMACVPFASWLAKRTGAIDLPGARRVHKKPIPRLGGVAMFAGLVAALVVVALGIFCFKWETPFGMHALLDDVNYVLLGVGVLIMFCVGLADDIKSLNPKVKLLGQLLAASVAASSGMLLLGVHVGGGFVSFGWVAYPLTVFYLVAFANIINLIDGLDGLASGIAAISSAAIMALSLMQGQIAAAFLCAGIIGACLGFLRFNFNPASIFMGDAGALTLGFLMGCVSLLAVAKSTLVVSLLVPVVAAGIPVLDTAAAIIRRIRGRRPIDEADKGHLHHRLLEAGYSQRSTVLIMWAWTAVLSACGVALVYTGGWVRWGIGGAIVLLAAFILLRFDVLRPVLVHGYDKELAKGAAARGGSADAGVGADGAEGEGGGAEAVTSPAEPSQFAQVLEAAGGGEESASACCGDDFTHEGDGTRG